MYFNCPVTGTLQQQLPLATCGAVAYTESLCGFSWKGYLFSRGVLIPDFAFKVTCKNTGSPELCMLALYMVAYKTDMCM